MVELRAASIASDTDANVGLRFRKGCAAPDAGAAHSLHLDLKARQGQSTEVEHNRASGPLDPGQGILHLGGLQTGVVAQFNALGA